MKKWNSEQKHQLDEILSKMSREELDAMLKLVEKIGKAKESGFLLNSDTNRYTM